MTTSTTQQTYRISTDADSGDVLAPSLAAAIRRYFGGRNLQVRDVRSLHRYMAAYTPDGAWCRIERDGERLVEIGITA
jgi:hypothetical protein